MKTYIITGGNSGLGYETAKRIALNSIENHVILACRNLKKGNIAAKEIEQITENNHIKVMKLDLCSLRSVRCFVDEIIKMDVKIDGLDNNAGISGSHTGLTDDGIDVVFQSNHLGHFLLTNLLLPYMKDNGRILNISSDMHNPPYGELIWKSAEILAYPTQSMNADNSRYFYSKLCNLYFTYELSRRLKSKGSHITVSALNPGFMGDTNLSQGKITNERIEEVKRTMPERYGELSVSAQAAADILTKKEYEVNEARYYNRSTVFDKSSDLSYNEEHAKELWDVSLKLVDRYL